MNQEVVQFCEKKQKKRLILKNKNSINQLSLMVFITIIIQVTSLVRTSIIASKFGVSVEIDALNFTNSIAGFIFSFVSSGITTILIPNMIKKENTKSINSFITFIYFMLFILLFVIIIIKRELIILVSGRSGEFVEIAEKLMSITLISQLSISILGVTNAIFQCNDKFNTPKILTFITNILLIIILLSNSNLDIYNYSIYVGVISLLNLVLNILFTKNLDYNFKINLGLKDDKLKKLLKEFLPIIMSTGLYQVTLITDTMLASRIGEGSISILNYSNSIISMLNTLLLANIISFIYPKIVRNAYKEDDNRILFEYFTILSAIMFLIVAGVILVGRDGIALLYERGEFDSSITELVFTCSIIAVISLPVNAMRDLIYRYFYSLNDTLTPFKNSILISVLNLIISIILSNIIGIYGIILGTVITSYISLFTILIRFSKKYTIKYSIKKLIIENLKIILSTILVVCIVSKIRQYIFNMGYIVNIAVMGSITTLLFVAILYSLKSIVFKVKI